MFLLLLLLLACLSDQLELSEHACVHLLVVRVGVVAVASCGGGIWAGTPAFGPAAGVVTDALIAALVIRKFSKIMQHFAAHPSGDVRCDVALRALRLWGDLCRPAVRVWGVSTRLGSRRRRCRVVRDPEGRGRFARDQPLSMNAISSCEMTLHVSGRYSIPRALYDV